MLTRLQKCVLLDVESLEGNVGNGPWRVIHGTGLGASFIVAARGVPVWIGGLVAGPQHLIIDFFEECVFGAFLLQVESLMGDL